MDTIYSQRFCFLQKLKDNPSPLLALSHIPFGGVDVYVGHAWLLLLLLLLFTLIIRDFIDDVKRGAINPKIIIEKISEYNFII